MESGHRLHDARRRLRMTQGQLAKAAGVSSRTVRRAETGLEVSDESLRCICAVLGVDCSEMPTEPVSHETVSMAEAMACLDPRRYDAKSSPVSPVAEPTLGEFAASILGSLIELGPFLACMILFIFYGLGGVLMALASGFLGSWGWACYFALAIPFSLFLGMLSLMRSADHGRAVYVLRCRLALCVAPVSALAYAIMEAGRPDCMIACGTYLVVCIAFGVPIGVGGMARLVLLDRPAGTVAAAA